VFETAVRRGKEPYEDDDFEMGMIKIELEVENSNFGELKRHEMTSCEGQEMVRGGQTNELRVGAVMSYKEPRDLGEGTVELQH